MDDFVKDVLLPEMKKIYSESNIKKEIIGEIVGFKKEEKSEAVNLICNLTGDNSRNVVSFGTEAGLFQELGISTVVCGPGSIEQAHKIDEYVSFDELKSCLKMLINLKDQISN
jgi:acetylornithine deacetylase